MQSGKQDERAGRPRQTTSEQASLPAASVHVPLRLTGRVRPTDASARLDVAARASAQWPARAL